MKALHHLLTLVCFLSLATAVDAGWSPAPNTEDSPSTPLLRLQTIETGIYRVSAKQVAEQTGTELSKLVPENMNLYYKGQAVPIWVENLAQEGWSEDGYLEFFGTFLEGTYSTRGRYSEKRSYFLVEDSADPVRFSLMRPGPNLPELPKGTLYSTFHHEAYYTSGFWHYDGETFDYFCTHVLKTGTSSWERSVPLPDLDWKNEELYIRGKVYGRSNLGPNPDHHVIFSVNETPVADFTFDGAREYYFSETIPSGVVKNNTLEIKAEAPGDLLKKANGPKFDVVMIDWVRLDYPSNLHVHQGKLDVSTLKDENQNKTHLAKFTNFTGTDKRVYDVGNHLRLFLDNNSTAPVLINNETRVIASTSQSTLSPIETSPVNTMEISQLASANQLVIITHPDLITEANRLADHKNETGMSACVISIEDIYNQFNDGMKDPIAIKSMLNQIHGTQENKLRYVLLAGSACKDPQKKDYRTEGNIDYIPTPYFHSWLYPDYPWDTWYGSFGEDDSIPQIAIGRIPSRNSEEFAHTIDKIIEYETVTTPSWAKNAVLMASVEDSIISSTEQCADIILQNHPAAQITRVYADKKQEDTTIWVKQSVSAINQGCGFLIFIGHGATARWGQGPIGRKPERFLFDLEAVDEISNKGKYPIAIAGTCYSAVFDTDRDIELLGRKLLQAKDRGAIAVIAPSYRSSVSGATDSAKFMTTEILSPENKTIGDAFLKGHSKIRDRETRAALTLLGDPSLRIQHLQK